MRTCSDVQRDLSRYLDDDLPPDEQAAIAEHLASCEVCRGLEADLRQIRSRARTLGPVPPPGHVWLNVADRLRIEDAREARPSADFERRPPAPRLRRSADASREGGTSNVETGSQSRRGARAAWPWLRLAAAVVVIGLGVYIAASISRRAPAAPDNAARTVSVQDVAEELDQALAHYDRAVAGLETLAREDGASMDPAVSAALQTNLTAIDRAIAESRAALVDDPQSASARASLADALRQKVDVLQTTVALVNDLRRENEDDAAEAAKKLGKQS